MGNIARCRLHNMMSPCVVVPIILLPKTVRRRFDVTRVQSCWRSGRPGSAGFGPRPSGFPKSRFPAARRLLRDPERPPLDGPISRRLSEAKSPFQCRGNPADQTEFRTFHVPRCTTILCKVRVLFRNAFTLQNIACIFGMYHQSHVSKTLVNISSHDTIMIFIDLGRCVF